MGVSLKRIVVVNCCLFVAAVCFSVATSTTLVAQNFSTTTFSSSQFVEYERQLNAILKTRRDEEKRFVEQVVRQVRLGNIPSKLVSTSFGWVRNKRPGTKYPFIYFERVLRLQAQSANLGNQIPAFDMSIYSSPGQNQFRQSVSAGQRSASTRVQIPTAGQR